MAGLKTYNLLFRNLKSETLQWRKQQSQIKESIIPFPQREMKRLINWFALELNKKYYNSS